MEEPKVDSLQEKSKEASPAKEKPTSQSLPTEEKEHAVPTLALPATEGSQSLFGSTPPVVPSSPQQPEINPKPVNAPPKESANLAPSKATENEVDEKKQLNSSFPTSASFNFPTPPNNKPTSPQKSVSEGKPPFTFPSNPVFDLPSNDSTLPKKEEKPTSSFTFGTQPEKHADPFTSVLVSTGTAPAAASLSEPKLALDRAPTEIWSSLNTPPPDLDTTKVDSFSSDKGFSFTATQNPYVCRCASTDLLGTRFLLLLLTVAQLHRLPQASRSPRV